MIRIQLTTLRMLGLYTRRLNMLDYEDLWKRFRIECNDPFRFSFLWNMNEVK